MSMLCWTRPCNILLEGPSFKFSSLVMVLPPSFPNMTSSCLIQSRYPHIYIHTATHTHTHFSLSIFLPSLYLSLSQGANQLAVSIYCTPSSHTEFTYFSSFFFFHYRTQIKLSDNGDSDHFEIITLSEAECTAATHASSELSLPSLAEIILKKSSNDHFALDSQVLYVCMHACMHACMHVCMYVCIMYVCIRLVYFICS